MFKNPVSMLRRFNDRIKKRDDKKRIEGLKKQAQHDAQVEKKGFKFGHGWRKFLKRYQGRNFHRKVKEINLFPWKISTTMPSPKHMPIKPMRRVKRGVAQIRLKKVA